MTSSNAWAEFAAILPKSVWGDLRVLFVGEKAVHNQASVPGRYMSDRQSGDPEREAD
jgi:hypothetical protein